MLTISDKEVEQMLLDNGLQGASFFVGDNFDSAIIGYTGDGRVVYSYELMIDWLKNTDMCSDEEAIEWIEYNTIRSVPYMGDTSPIIVYRMER